MKNTTRSNIYRPIAAMILLCGACHPGCGWGPSTLQRHYMQGHDVGLARAPPRAP